MEDKKTIVKLSRVKVNNKPIIVITHSYGLYDHLKEQRNVKWSQSLKRFYIKDTHPDLLEFIAKNKQIASLDLLDLHRQEKYKASSKQIESNRDYLKSANTFVELNEEILIKIGAVRNYMEQQRYADKTISTYLSNLYYFFSQNEQLTWDGITNEVLDKYNHDYFIKNKLSYSAQNQWISAMKTYLKVHDLEQVADQLERPKQGYYLPDILTEDEVAQILRTPKNLKHTALLMLIYSGGLRIGEALSLKLGDIRSKEGLIYIRSAKGQKDRRVPLSNKLLETLRRYFTAYQPQVFLFEGSKGGMPYSASSARKVFKNVLTLNGIDRKITLHGLRHSFATHLTNRGVNIQYLQSILGHNSPKTTMIYTHLSAQDIKEIRSPLDDMDL